MTHTLTITGFTARVNWVACEDVGAIGAALLLRGLRSPPPPDASTSAAVKAVFEVRKDQCVCTRV